MSLCFAAGAIENTHVYYYTSSYNIFSLLSFDVLSYAQHYYLVTFLVILTYRYPSMVFQLYYCIQTIQCFLGCNIVISRVFSFLKYCEYEHLCVICRIIYFVATRKIRTSQFLYLSTWMARFCSILHMMNLVEKVSDIMHSH